ncbi:MAG: pyruvate, phosphate dikinase [Bacteroidetes bacterium GWC2_33_15]|nr:MAG: pyruvate, phosphate dikinase [Bacteroidetes bacterium GWA2_33_15]OFX49690.1 MAG: pyruvate, phosphate dikinase [Bacteroidetes bacterium GWC2_33_15]OFX65920.1 MAG: pyruvate, phosphate dikinase [Bacteroidetes bacterium GWB2_32_14]OFX68319.1 MAG: pyruvate, phosphate dikinase [Bacteroidetes bacterium GWD2_33_33]HAN18104.1 pyruvate, phosphate dikinase [Bacteroidales bacterium]
MSNVKRVYTFGDKKAEGNASMKNLLGGKGANLAEMNLIGVPVPPGFTITTDVCAEYNKLGKDKVVELLKTEVEAAVKYVEKIMGTQFGSNENPLLVSVRSGARASMPGMMDTILNLGMNDAAVEGITKRTGNARFAWDSYRRFVQMYGDVVLGMKPQSKEEIDPFEEIMEQVKHAKGVHLDTELTVDDLKELVIKFKAAVKKQTGHDFPTNPWEQLWGSVMAVFDSWQNPRAVYYRALNQIPEEWGTAVNVQAMVFGNMGENSGTGVAFTRNASTGEDIFNGEYLINAQGEDVVAGIRTPQEITKEGSLRWAKLTGVSEEERAKNYPSLEEKMPAIYKELNEVQQKLEDHYKDMQDLEFTIQDGKLWMLQTRNGKRTAAAMVKIAMDLLKQGVIDEKTAILRQEPNKLDELLHPVFSKEGKKNAKVLAKGLPASPGAATGQIVFFADEAKKFPASILVRTETSPEDLEGMNIAKGILTARGGMTSHAAVVARGMGKCCVSGAGAVNINYKTRIMNIDGVEFKEGDWISLNGSTGEVYQGKIETQDPDLSGDFGDIMKMADKYRVMDVRTNADTPHDAKVAREFGAHGIGLCRTEHMFFEGERIKAMREMILAETEKDRRKALEKLLPYQRSDFEGILEAMAGYGVTIRLLDPPLHEFVPHEEANQKEMAKEMGISVEEIKRKVDSLHEFNPMLGHRGCRLGITYPEITEMQARAIIEAAVNLKKKGIDARPEIMIPLIGTAKEFTLQEELIRKTAEKVFAEKGTKIDYLVGTMIEIPRAALTAGDIAERAEFFSFGTNDLTQMTFGYSRDDAGKFLPVYLKQGILKNDPFQILDQTGVGQLVEMGTKNGRAKRPNLKVGICGEHGGEPSSVEFCFRVGMNYVSCSPFRVPIARLASAQATIKAGK